jgi:putative oxidoreductase
LGIGTHGSLLGAVFTEVVLSFLLIIGLFTRLASAGLFFTMFVAAVMVHGADPLAKKELAIIYGLVYLALFLTGAGQYSLSAKINSKWVQ